MKVTMEINYEVEASREGETEEQESQLHEAVGDLVDSFIKLVRDNVEREGNVRSIKLERD